MLARPIGLSSLPRLRSCCATCFDAVLCLATTRVSKTMWALQHYYDSTSSHLAERETHEQ